MAEQYYRQTNKKNISYIRFLNAIPQSGGYDIYIDNRTIAKNLKYKEFTKYLKAYPGYYLLQIYNTGTKENPLFSNVITIEKDMIYTAALTNLDGQFHLNLIEDRFHEGNPNYTYVRYMNLSPMNRDIDILLNNTPIVSRLHPMAVTQYISLNPGKHTLEIRDSETQKTLAVHPGTNFNPKKYYAVSFVEGPNNNGGTEILIPLEGATYLKQ